MSKFSAKTITYTAVFAALISVCAWITLPAPVPFTLQILGIFLAGGVLGGRRGTLPVLVYILLAAMGLPVLSGFRGGLGALLGNTGGYVLGFLLIPLTIWAGERLFGGLPRVLACSMVLGLLLCYTFGTLWFILLYTRSTGPITLVSVLSSCVFPFVVPDLLKLFAALALTRRLKRHIR